LLITRTDYERIYRVINTLLLNEGAEPSVACIFFSAFGAFILETHFRIEATARCGLAAFHTGDDNVLVLGDQRDGAFVSDSEGFHCWVEAADGWVIDFMSPAFSRLSPRIPAKMFQRKIDEMAAAVHDIRAEGDFYFEASDVCTSDKMAVLASRRAYGDLADIARQWFKPAPKKMQETIQIGDQHGRLKSVSLQGVQLVGSWSAVK
jgi:hypothetical protein